MNNKTLVATYGTLRKNQSNHRILENKSNYLGTFKTKPKYTMRSLGHFPAVSEQGNTSITVEVYEVDAEVKQRLDYLEGHEEKGSLHNFYDITELETPYGVAKMYVINSGIESKPIINSGDWLNKL